MAKVLIEIDESRLAELLKIGDVAATHHTVDWQTDRQGGVLDNWKWWVSPPNKFDSDRAQLDLIGLLEAIYDGMATEDRLRLFAFGKPRFKNLRKWMCIE